MAKNSGKLFEDNFADSNTNALIQRFYDVMSYLKGQSYPCDYLVYNHGLLCFLELKSTNTGTWPIKNMSDNQYNGLLTFSTYKGVVSGALIKYAKFDKHYFVPITEIKRIKESGHASIRHKHITDGDIVCVEMFGEKKRVNWTYDIDKLILDLKEWSNHDN